eukprot:GHVL01021023.1.p1 GENE.GHVL01021023.1~~GHVL01021023.1.p1  ORF type:complete len:421 (-),score=39.80 GHVL01021023.1:142-1404(-)
MNVIGLFGGVNRQADCSLIKVKKPHLIVATPGRILDHLQHTFSFTTLLENANSLVLDEADRLLELGFLDTLHSIVAFLPKARQSMLFSATINKNVEDVASQICRSNYDFVNCVGPEEVPTSDDVEQHYVIVRSNQIATCLFHILLQEMKNNIRNYKIIVFFPTARSTIFFAKFFRQQFKIAVYEIHNVLNSEERLLTSNRFKQDNCGILFTSDISARGMHYPNVSLVIQVAPPVSREQYIHRVGRTARIGKKGKAMLLLEDSHTHFLKQLSDIPITKVDDVSLTVQNDLVMNALSSWQSNTQLLHCANLAYASLLGYFTSQRVRLNLDNGKIVDASFGPLMSCGLLVQPSVSHNLALRLDMENEPKLKVSALLTDTFDEGSSNVERLLSAAEEAELTPAGAQKRHKKMMEIKKKALSREN